MRRSHTLLSAIMIALLSPSPLTAQEKTASAGAYTPASVRVVSRAAEILTRPGAQADVVMTAVEGTVLEVIDKNGSWYWVMLAPDRNGTRRPGWIHARDVQPVNAVDVKTSTIPPTIEDIQAAKARREIEERPRAIEERRVEKARREMERRRQEYEAALRSHGATETPKAKSRVPFGQSVGIRAFGAIDTDTLTAQKSFNAVLGTSRLTTFGGGADVLNIWRTAFVRGAVSHTSKSGNRALVANGQVISLNIPIKVSMTPVEIGGGWRFVPSRSAHIVPYAGGGVLIQPYSEKSTFAGTGDDVSQTSRGFTAFGGVEVDVSKWLVVGGEAQFRGVPNAIGKGGVSQDFGETNLGGFALRVLIGVRR